MENSQEDSLSGSVERQDPEGDKVEATNQYAAFQGNKRDRGAQGNEGG